MDSASGLRLRSSSTTADTDTDDASTVYLEAGETFSLSVDSFNSLRSSVSFSSTIGDDGSSVYSFDSTCRPQPHLEIEEIPDPNWCWTPTPQTTPRHVTKWADEVQTSRQKCLDLESKTERLSSLLRQAARTDLVERPTRRIMDDTEQVLEKALSLVAKCRARGLVSRVFTIIPASAFKKMSSQLDNSIGDVSWLLRVSKSANDDDDDDDDDDGYLGLPPIAANEPILCLIWEQIAKLHTGTPDAAQWLVSLARDNDRYGKLIIEEGGVAPLLKLIKEGRLEGQEAAAKALGLLGKDPESVETLVQAGVCSVFTKILEEGPMKVQAVVAWAIAELAERHPKGQDVFAQNNAVQLLVGHLAFETVQEHSKYTVPKETSVHLVVMANASKTGVNYAVPTMGSGDEGQSQVKNQGVVNRNPMHSVVQSTISAKNPPPTQQKVSSGVPKHHNMNLAGTSIKGREFEDPETKAYMKAMSARALWQLAKGNSAICTSITESKALLCFAVLLEKGQAEVQYNSVMALMEIARVVEKDAELRRSAFKSSSPAAKAVVDQLLRVVEKGDYTDLLVPSIVALGCLSRTFRATETRIIGPLVRFLDEREPEVMRQAAIALTKFACTENNPHHYHSKATIAAGGAEHLVQLVYLGEQGVQIPALILLCYVAIYVPDSKDLAQAEVLTVLEWASKQGSMVKDELVNTLLPEAKSRLELYQSRGTRGFQH